MLKKIIAILVLTASFGLMLTGCGDDETGQVEGVERVAKSDFGEPIPVVDNGVKIAKISKNKGLLSGYNGGDDVEVEGDDVEGFDLDDSTIVISSEKPTPSSGICVPGYCDEDERFLARIDFGRESDGECEEGSLCAPDEFKRAFGVKWCPKEGYVESVQVDDGMLF